MVFGFVEKLETKWLRGKVMDANRADIYMRADPADRAERAERAERLVVGVSGYRTFQPVQYFNIFGFTDSRFRVIGEISVQPEHPFDLLLDPPNLCFDNTLHALCSF